MAVLALFLGACATMQSRSPAVSILVDLDPASADRTVIVESITADKEGRLYLPDRVTGNILRVDTKAPKSVVVGRIDAREIKGKKVNTDPSGSAFNLQGDLFTAVGPFSEVVRIRLYVADTARGAIWQVAIGADGKGGKPALLAQSPLLEGADGLAFDRTGKLWVAANERNAIVTVAPDGQVQEIAKNGSSGPLEFPAAIVFVGSTAYIANYDTPRRDNLDANGKGALDGIGASIAQISP
jgi:sugar lactone lactonase YvrE